MNENELARLTVDVGYHIHRQLGPGLLESVYEQIMAYELSARGLDVRRQVSIPVRWKSQLIEVGYRADIIVNDTLLIELKSIDDLAPIHGKQTLTYLRLANLRLGLLINFNSELFKDGVRRIVNNLPETTQ